MMHYFFGEGAEAEVVGLWWVDGPVFERKYE